MSTTVSTPPARDLASKALRWSGMLWFIVAAIGQTAFIGFIIAFYGVRTATGDFAGWNDKPLIDGYIEGDDTGNLVFAAHVLLAAVVTLGGLMQLIPAIRRRLPGLHRWTGRIFLVVAIFMSLSGVWLTVVRGTYLSPISAVAILIDGLLILMFAGLAWRHAIKRRFEQHRKWAMRTFMVVSGVWFLRIGLMGWVIVNQGPAGLTDDLSGPIDSIMTFGSFLIPLTLLELYFAAQRSSGGALKILAALVVVAAATYTALGVIGTVAFMWGPYI